MKRQRIARGSKKASMITLDDKLTELIKQRHSDCVDMILKIAGYKPHGDMVNLVKEVEYLYTLSMDTRRDLLSAELKRLQQYLSRLKQ